MAEITYLLCAVTSVFAAALLLRRYLQQKTNLLFWSALAFGGLAVNNIVSFVDLVLVPDVDLAPLRAASAAISGAVLLCALVWESR